MLEIKITGARGEGKTTLAHMIMNMLKRNGHTLRYSQDGQPPSTQKPYIQLDTRLHHPATILIIDGEQDA